MTATSLTPRVRIGQIWFDRLTFAQAVAAVERLIDGGHGGVVFTPNTDHLVRAEDDQALREAYLGADLAFVDGMPIVWASRLLGTPLPERIAGSDLAPALLKRAARSGRRVYLLGALPAVANKAAANLSAKGVTVVGVASPAIGLTPLEDEEQIVAGICMARPDLVLVALGSPKQELFIHRCAARLAPAVCLGVGATIDFLAGRFRRAPRWMSRAGLEWFFRLLQEPRRLARRYLWDDPRFVMVVWRTFRSPREARQRNPVIGAATSRTRTR